VTRSEHWSRRKDENSQAVLELKISALLSPKMDINEFVRLFKKDVVINMNVAQEELKLEEEKVES